MGNGPAESQGGHKPGNVQGAEILQRGYTQIAMGCTTGWIPGSRCVRSAEEQIEIFALETASAQRMLPTQAL